MTLCCTSLMFEVSRNTQMNNQQKQKKTKTENKIGETQNFFYKTYNEMKPNEK